LSTEVAITMYVTVIVNCCAYAGHEAGSSLQRNLQPASHSPAD